ncbi:calcium/proton exchanger [Bradyrhizobium sp. CCBAU 45384]|uniref:calcium/proton exchanger n=1 Tax=Bradyrhizobium sp. CCBAU 45384 TaxID=858428 RepID=UPI00230602EB|nr:calcium/proton exchanger [Bradyrhizobium sp. CCBAU 45384]
MSSSSADRIEHDKPSMVLMSLLVLIPISLGLKYAEAPVLTTFVASAGAIAVLAEWIRRGTEQLARHAGPTIGGLVMVSFGSVAELVLALFVLASGQPSVVQAQITGSIIGTSLLGLGIAILAGGLSRRRQTFSSSKASLLSTLLILAVIALLLPAIFDYAARQDHLHNVRLTDEKLSLGASVVLLVLYGGNLVYTLITHRDAFADDEAHGEPAWNLRIAIGVVVGCTALIAVEAEIVSKVLTQTATALSISEVFLGVIVLALVGTSADLFAASWFARADRMTLALSICIGSAIQLVLVVTPVLVLISAFMNRPMSLVFGNPCSPSRARRSSSMPSPATARRPGSRACFSWECTFCSRSPSSSSARADGCAAPRRHVPSAFGKRCSFIGMDRFRAPLLVLSPENVSADLAVPPEGAFHRLVGGNAGRLLRLV